MLARALDAERREEAHQSGPRRQMQRQGQTRPTGPNVTSAGFGRGEVESESERAIRAAVQEPPRLSRTLDVDGVAAR